MAFSPAYPIRCLGDVRRLEDIPLEEHLTAKNTYELFVNSAAEFGDKTALRFLKTGEPGAESIAWSYKELLAGIIKQLIYCMNWE